MVNTVQFDSGKDRLVVQRTVKEALGVFVKSNWKLPLPNRVGATSNGALALGPVVVKVRSLPKTKPGPLAATVRK